jgi:hypothetical protein
MYCSWTDVRSFLRDVQICHPALVEAGYVSEDMTDIIHHEDRGHEDNFLYLMPQSVTCIAPPRTDIFLIYGGLE